MKPIKFFVFAVLLPLLLSMGISSAWAQDQPTPEPDKQAPNLVREQTIYVPYENLRKTFEKDGRGVYLPYEQFRELWDEVQKGREKPKPQPLVSPIPYMMTETTSEATVSGDIVKVESKIRIELLRKGWMEIPLRLSDVAITKAEIGGEPAKLLHKTHEGYRILLEGKSDSPGSAEQKNDDAKSSAEEFTQSVELILHFAKAIDKTPGRNSVSFEAPIVPISRWKVRIPESDVKIEFAPLIVATEEKTEQAPKDGAPPTADETVLLALAGGAPTVQIAWAPKTEGATGLEALTSVQLEEKVFVEEGTVRTEARLAYAISRSQIQKLTIEVPGDQKVVELFDPNIRKWTVEQREGKQILNVDLFEPAKTSQTVNLKLERFLDQADATESAKKATMVEIPLISAVGVARQQGVLVVQAAEGLSTDPQKTTGLVQMDESDLPQTLQGTKWNYAYRISSSNYGFSLSLEKAQPRITSSSQVSLRIGESTLYCYMQTRYQIERAGVFQLVCDIPEGFSIDSLQGGSFGGASPAAVESHQIEQAGENAEQSQSMKRVTINLARKTIGNVGLHLVLTKSINEAKLSDAEGKPFDYVFHPPVVAKDSVERRELKLVVNAIENLRMTPGKTVGLQTVPLEQLSWEGGFKGLVTPQTNDDLIASQGTWLGFVGGEEPASIELKIQRRQPQTTMRQALRVRVENGVVKYADRFDATVLYSGVKSFRIDVPETVAGKIRNQTKTVRETKMDPQPTDVEKGYVAYRFEKDGEWFGSDSFELTWEDEIKPLDVGREVPISVSRLIPRDVDRSFGQIVLSHAETISLRESEETQGLRAIDPQSEVLARDRIDSAVTAMEFFDDWKLDLLATRFRNEDVKRTSIEQGLLQVVSVRSSENLTARGFYRIRSVKQRLAVALPDHAIVNEVRIDGKPVALESDHDAAVEKDGIRSYLVPLNSVAPDTPFFLEIRYMYPGTVASISVPSFPGESLGDTGSIPAVQNMNLAVFIPEDYVVVHYDGAWTPRFRFRSGFPAAAVENDPNIGQVVDDIFGNSTASREMYGHFPVAGNMYLFTTVQPGSEPDDSLRLVTMWEKGLKGIVFGFIVLVGLVLCPFRWQGRLLVVILLAAALLVGGLFCPTTKAYLFQQPVFLDIIFLVVLFWIVVSLARWGRKAYRDYHASLATQPQSPPPRPEPPRPPAVEEQPATEPHSPSPQATPMEETKEYSENRNTEGGN